MPWDDGNSDPKVFEDFLACFAGAQLAGLSIMRQQVISIEVRLGTQFLDVVVERLAGILVIIDDVDFTANELAKPDRGCISDAQVPSRDDFGHTVVGNRADLLVVFETAYL